MNNILTLILNFVVIFLLSDSIECRSLENEAYLMPIDDYAFLKRNERRTDNEDDRNREEKNKCPYTCIFSAPKDTRPKPEYVPNLPSAESFLRNSKSNFVYLTPDNNNGINHSTSKNKFLYQNQISKKYFFSGHRLYYSLENENGRKR